MILSGPPLSLQCATPHRGTNPPLGQVPDVRTTPARAFVSLRLLLQRLSFLFVLSASPRFKSWSKTESQPLISSKTPCTDPPLTRSRARPSGDGFVNSGPRIPRRAPRHYASPDRSLLAFCSDPVDGNGPLSLASAPHPYRETGTFCHVAPAMRHTASRCGPCMRAVCVDETRSMGS